MNQEAVARMRRWSYFALMVGVTLNLAAKDELPLKSEGTLDFSVESVTWLSFDLSSMEQTFVLEVLGDLYTVPVDGGTATPLKTGLAFDSQPVYSPDGEKIAFISDQSGSENVWVMNSDGSDARPLSDTRKDSEIMSPSWAPDGSHVIASVGNWERRTYQIWAYHLDGGKGVRLAPRRDNDGTRSQNYVGPVYSPDGKYLYYAYKEGGFGYNQALPLWQLRRQEIATNEQVELTNAAGSAFRPSLSPNGESLVYGTRFDTRTGLRLRNLRTGEDSWLVYPVQRDDQESRYTRDLLPQSRFSKDGNTLYYTADGKLRAVSLVSKETFDIPFEIDIELDHIKRIEFPYRIGMGPVRAQLLRGAEESPDGKQLAFSALARIYTFEYATREITQITDAGMFAAQPTWSPDGRQIGYVSWQDGSGDVWRIKSNGKGKPTRVSRNSAFYFDPVWHPDGNSIIVMRASAVARSVIASDFGQGVATDLVELEIKGERTNLISHASNMRSPHFGSTTERIFVYEWPGNFQSGTSGLSSMRHDGSDLHRHLSVSGPGIYNSRNGLPAVDMRVAPDGHHVLVKQANQLYLMKLLGPRTSSVTTKVTSCSLPCVRLTDVGVDDFAWGAGGEDVIWTTGFTIHRRPVQSIFAEEEDEESDDESEDKEKPTRKPLLEEHDSVSVIPIELYVPRYEPEGSLVLRNATVLPVSTDEPNPSSGVDVLLKGGRIEAIGENLIVEDHVDELDLTGKFVVPGYVDTHAHFPLMRNVVAGEAWSLLANLAYGVTTAIDVQPSTTDVLEYEDLVDAGRIVGPRTLSTGPGVFSDTMFGSKREAVAILRRYKDHYGVRNLKSYILGNREKRQWMVEAARELKLNPTTEGALDLKLDLTQAIDGFTGQEHNLPVIGIYDDVIQLFSRTKISYTPTLMVSYGGPFGQAHYIVEESPRGDSKLARFTPPAILERKTLRSAWFHPDTHVYQRHAKQALDIVRAGGRVGVGSHGELNGLGFHWELWALSSGGFSHFEALRAATRHGAEMIGIAEDVGSVEVGKLADLVVLNDNPYDDIRATNAIAYVIQHGTVRNADDLTEIWPKQRRIELPKWDEPIYSNE